MLLSLSFSLKEGIRRPQGFWNPKFAWSCQRRETNSLQNSLNYTQSSGFGGGRTTSFIGHCQPEGGDTFVPLSMQRFLRPLGAHGAGI